MDCESARLEYDELGFDTLPLIPGMQRAYPHAWQSRSTYRMWQNAPQDANIGIRGGGIASVAFFDCDEPRTFENVTGWLAGFGYQAGDYPVVKSAGHHAGGRHVYVSFAGGLTGELRHLAQDVGPGEFRYGAGSFVVAPPSVLTDGGAYALISGEFARLPSLKLADALQIVDERGTQITPKPALSRKAVALLHGKTIENYRTRSEAEQALLASLANAGFSPAEVLDLFNRNPCAGKYAELRAKNPRNAERWLLHSYSEATKWSETHVSKARQTAQAAITWAESTPWPGSTGASDQAAFIAAAQIAYRAGKLEFAAACRDVAERARISRPTAMKSLYRLVKAYRLLDRVKESQGDCAHTYCFIVDPRKALPLPKTPYVWKWSSFAEHDAFRKGRGKAGLGKAAGKVYQTLRDCGELTVDELATRTGRDRRTVKRVLGRMARIVDRKTGEIISMVASADGGDRWQALDVDLESVATIVETAGVTERQKRLHERERREHARELERGRQAGQS